MFEIELPLFIMLPRKTKADKRIALNLNIYRNLHYMILNQSKVAFKEIISGRLSGLPAMDKIELNYTLYPPTKRLIDVANVCSVVDKYFCDCLVELGKIPDDNYNHLQRVTYNFGAIDKVNPRVDVEILEEIGVNHTGN